ncbi:hypothetical protein NHX12_005541 [Muraenolepis orangiensis]|uniref:Uncharacterized protein n=1 Tax=Muraenolepis orangiensis TaxID=630683 RepID=A0A9Q0DQV3_9TELE|nr:hypothetical protein NHX12_005541 [Muraenolepis orangiensis]
MVNCSQTIPHVEEFMRGLSPVTWVFLVILLAMSLSSCALFMELWVYLSRNVISVAALVGMTVPRAATVVYLAISAYTGVTLLVFFHLTLAYLGGEVEMLDKMQSVDCVPFIFELLTTYDIIPCTAQFSWQGRASEFHHMAHVVEAFLLMLLARVFYRKPYPLHETEPLLSVDNSLLYMP